MYRSVLRWTLKHRVMALAGLVTLAGSAFIPFMLIEKTGDVSERERDVSIVLHVHDPADLNSMEAHVNRVEAWLRTKKDQLGYESVYSFYNQHGYAVSRVFLPWNKATETYLRQTRENLKADLPVMPGVTLQVGDEDRFSRGGGGNRRLVTVALHGEDPEYLREVATGVEKLLRRVEGVKDIFGPTQRGEMEARLLVDSDRARALDVSPRQIADAISFTFRGRRLKRTQDDLEMFLSLPEDLRPGLADLSQLDIPRLGAGPVPLGSVAQISMDRTEEQIRRDQRKTTQRVTVEFDPAVTTDTGMTRIRTQMSGLTLPQGYGWDWGQRGEDRDDALQIMMHGVTLSLCLVILLMAALFESILQPAAIVITLPLAFFGAFWALWLLGYKLEPVAFMGVIILIGMVVNNGIVMVDHVNRLRREGRDRIEALVQGCGDRLRPIVMTAITTIFGLAPLATSGFAVGGVPVESMAITILGGLASSTLFTLVALPVWYTMVEDLFAVVLRSLPQVAPRSAAPPAGVLASGPVSSGQPR